MLKLQKINSSNPQSHAPNQTGDIPPKPHRTLAPSSDSSLVPISGFLRQKQVLVLVPFSKSTLWRRVQHGSFPKPVKLSPRVTVWRTQDIRTWIEKYAAAHQS